MAEGNRYSPFSPHPQYPEKPSPIWERKYGQNNERRGPLRFEEGVATDTDVPNSFTDGVLQGYQTAPGRPNHNRKVDTKWPAETMAERAHVGSASWIEAPTFNGEFAHGGVADYGVVQFEMVVRDGGHYMRRNPAQVTD